MPSYMERREPIIGKDKGVKGLLEGLCSLMEFTPISLILSTNCGCEVASCDWGKQWLLIFLSSLALERHLLQPSAMRIKRKGDSGSLCIIPQLGEKGWEGDLLMSTRRKQIWSCSWPNLSTRGKTQRLLAFAGWRTNECIKCLGHVQLDYHVREWHVYIVWITSCSAMTQQSKVYLPPK